MRQKRIAVLILPIVLALVSVALLVGYMRASESAVRGSERKLVVVADTSASMQPELDALANAFPGSVIRDNQVERDYHLVVYTTDTIDYKGNTTNPVLFKRRLGDLTAAGGDGCEGAMLQALAAAARGLPDSRALVLSDAGLMGDRSNFAFVMNKLIERGVNVYPVITDWCQNSELSQSVMFSLARMTGGVPFIQEVGEPVPETETETSLHSAIDMMALPDSLLVENSTIDGIRTFPLIVDSTATTLGVDEERCRVWCLTCTLTIQQAGSIVATDDIKLMVKDPDGNLLDANYPGVEIRERSGGSTVLIDVAEVYTPPPGQTSATWEIVVQGSGDYVLNAAADSAVHLDYLGQHVLPAGVDALVRARLSTSSGAPDIVGSGVQFAFKHVTRGVMIPVELFDDGQHEDGLAGDGIFGGPVRVRRGLWYLVARGELADGAQFERTHEVPIRAKGFKSGKPRDSQQVAGSSSMLQFQITNGEPFEVNQAASRTYELSIESLLGWSSNEGVPPMIVLEPGETKIVEVMVNVPQDAKPGDTEETFLTVVESGDIGASETLTVKTTVVDELKAYLPATLGN